MKYRLMLLVTLLLSISGLSEARRIQKNFIIGTQNIWGKQAPEVIDHFKKMDVDVLCTQESRHLDSTAFKDAGLHVHFSANNRKGPVCIISKYPFVGKTPHSYGIYIDLGDGVKVLVMNCHAAHKPYGPYQLNGIDYGKSKANADPQQVYEQNKKARQEMVDLLLEDILSAETDNIILCGDFNEPSWLDWTEQTTKAGLSACVLPWAATKSLYDAGFKGDAYRTIHPNPVKHPGFTWSSKPVEKDTKDRIDLILYKTGKKTKVKECKVVGESTETSDIVLKPWIFDHRGVRAVFQYRK